MEMESTVSVANVCILTNKLFVCLEFFDLKDVWKQNKIIKSSTELGYLLRFVQWDNEKEWYTSV